MALLWPLAFFEELLVRQCYMPWLCYRVSPHIPRQFSADQLGSYSCKVFLSFKKSKLNSFYFKSDLRNHARLSQKQDLF